MTRSFEWTLGHTSSLASWPAVAAPPPHARPPPSLLPSLLPRFRRRIAAGYAATGVSPAPGARSSLAPLAPCPPHSPSGFGTSRVGLREAGAGRGPRGKPLGAQAAIERVWSSSTGSSESSGAVQSTRATEHWLPLVKAT